MPSEAAIRASLSRALAGIRTLASDMKASSIEPERTRVHHPSKWRACGGQPVALTSVRDIQLDAHRLADRHALQHLPPVGQRLDEEQTPAAAGTVRRYGHPSGARRPTRYAAVGDSMRGQRGDKQRGGVGDVRLVRDAPVVQPARSRAGSSRQRQEHHGRSIGPVRDSAQQIESELGETLQEFRHCFNVSVVSSVHGCSGPSTATRLSSSFSACPIASSL